MLPRKCLTSCEVPYLCLIACPLNDRLEQLVFRPGISDDVKIDPDEQLDIEIAREPNVVAEIQTDTVHHRLGEEGVPKRRFPIMVALGSACPSGKL